MCPRSQLPKKGGSLVRVISEFNRAGMSVLAQLRYRLLNGGFFYNFSAKICLCALFTFAEAIGSCNDSHLKTVGVAFHGCGLAIIANEI